MDCNMKKIIFQIILLAIMPVWAFAQEQTTGVKWMTFEEAIQLQAKNPKTIMIDMYTDWCGWCKKMDAETFSHPDIAQYINQNFYPVKFNAETLDTIEYKGKKYTNMQRGQKSPHSLAFELLGGRMSYPTVVYIDYEGNVNPVGGFMTVEQIEPLLVFFAERVQKTASWQEFQECFDAAFHPEKDTADIFSGTVKWGDFNTMAERAKKEHKKLLLYIYSDWNSSSKIMTSGAFKDKYLADLINENYLAVRIPYDIKDTLKIAGREFVNQKNEDQYPNDIVLSLLHPDYRIPVFIVFDEDCNPQITQRGFSSNSTIEKILSYFKEEMHKKGMPIQEYFNNYKRKTN